MLYRVALQVYSLATVVTASVMYIHLTTTAAAPVVAAAAAATAAAAVLITKLLQRCLLFQYKVSAAHKVNIYMHTSATL
jgi:hypothetical protein